MWTNCSEQCKFINEKRLADKKNKKTATYCCLVFRSFKGCTRRIVETACTVVPVSGLIESMETGGYSPVRETDLMGFERTTLVLVKNQRKANLRERSALFQNKRWRERKRQILTVSIQLYFYYYIPAYRHIL